MGRVKPKLLSEKAIGSGPVQWRVVKELLKKEEPIQQSELAQKSGATEMTVSRIMNELTKDEKLREVFKTEKKYGVRIYWIERNHTLTKKLGALYEILESIEKYSE